MTFLAFRSKLINQLTDNSLSTIHICLYGITSIILYFLFTPYLFMALIKTTVLPFGLPWVFAVLFNHWLASPLPIYMSLIILAYILVDILGILSCYFANAAGDHKQFWTRFVCLSVPVRLYTYLKGAFWTLIIYFIGLLIVQIAEYFGLIEKLINSSTYFWLVDHTNIILVLLQNGTFLLITIWYYYLLRNDIARVAQSK